MKIKGMNIYEWGILICGLAVGVLTFLNKMEQNKSKLIKDAITEERDEVIAERDSLKLQLLNEANNKITKLTDGSTYPLIVQAPTTHISSISKNSLAVLLIGGNTIKNLVIYHHEIHDYSTLDSDFFRYKTLFTPDNNANALKIDRIIGNEVDVRSFMVDIKYEQNLYIFQLDTDYNRYYQYMFFDNSDKKTMKYISFLTRKGIIIRFDIGRDFSDQISEVINLSKNLNFKKENLIGKDIQSVFTPVE